MRTWAHKTSCVHVTRRTELQLCRTRRTVRNTAFPTDVCDSIPISDRSRFLPFRSENASDYRFLNSGSRSCRRYAFPAAVHRVSDFEFINFILGSSSLFFFFFIFCHPFPPKISRNLLAPV